MASPPDSTRAVAITGSGGSGAVTTGLILLDTLARAGYYGLMGRSAGPQIRGGESAAMLRYGVAPVAAMGDRSDVLVALDWRNVERFADEIRLDPASLVLADPAAGPVPEAIARAGAEVLELPLGELAGSVADGRANMVALGAVAALGGLPVDALHAAVARTLQRKGAAAVAAARECIALGHGRAPAGRIALPAAPAAAARRWNVSGNEACGLGALRGGVRFVAAYPITPATELLEWLAPRIDAVGGALLQAEDELASINMVLGASFGGVPSLTATSGPGLSLMAEGLGLAVASETPVVVVDVMRGGPSTGIPTKSEQSDLNLAVYGLHGDAPHLVLAPLSIADAALTTEWAVGLAEHLQAPALVLSDQLIGQSRAIVDAPPALDLPLARRTAPAGPDGYARYALTPTGVSPMAVPGTPGCMYTADGLEHDAQGLPSSSAGDHRAQLHKRRHKLEAHDYGALWGEIAGSGDTLVVTFGSTWGAVREAAGRLAEQAEAVTAVGLRLLAPLPGAELARLVARASRVLVVEQNHEGQLYRYLHACRALPAKAESYARPGPLPIRPADVVQAVRQGHCGQGQ